MCAIAQHFGRPGTPTDQAWIESLFSHIKADWPHLDAIRDPAAVDLAERWLWMSRTVIPRAYSAMTFSSKPTQRVWRLATICGSRGPVAITR